MSFARTRLAYTAVALVEITLVIAIIALLVAMAFPSFLRARKRGQASQISNRLRVIDTAANRYGIEHGNKYPDFR